MQEQRLQEGAIACPMSVWRTAKVWSQIFVFPRTHTLCRVIGNVLLLLLWAWRCDLLWPLGQRQMWCKQNLLRTCPIHVVCLLSRTSAPVRRTRLGRPDGEGRPCGAELSGPHGPSRGSLRPSMASPGVGLLVSLARISRTM